MMSYQEGVFRIDRLESLLSEVSIIFLSLPHTVLTLTSLRMSNSYESINMLIWQSLRARTDKALVQEQEDSAYSRAIVKQVLSFMLTEKVRGVPFSVPKPDRWTNIKLWLYGNTLSGFLCEGYTSPRTCQGKSQLLIRKCLFTFVLLNFWEKCIQKDVLIADSPGSFHSFLTAHFQ